MTEVAEITLENEMDLIVAYKKSIRVSDLLGLTISTQTAFATAVSEVCREVIDKAIDGVAKIGTTNDGSRFFLTAEIKFSDGREWRGAQEGFDYARKLVPVFETSEKDGVMTTTLKMGIPRSAGVDMRKVSYVKATVEREGPSSAYEEIKKKNVELSRIKLEQEFALVTANYLNKQKDEFLSIASHELNSPLTILRSLAQLALKTDDGLSEQVRGYLTKIEAQTTKLKILVQQLLDKSKIESGQNDYVKERTSLRAFLNNTVELYRPLAPNHSIKSAPVNDCIVFIDRLRVEQVMNNLLGNATKYSAAGTDISVIVEIEGKRVVIRVADQGIGLSEEAVSQVFQKFYRSEQIQKKYYGLGMGLYIASIIVAAHNGEIWVESELGKGSVFSFSLDVVE